MIEIVLVLDGGREDHPRVIITLWILIDPIEAHVVHEAIVVLAAATKEIVAHAVATVVDRPMQAVLEMMIMIFIIHHHPQPRPRRTKRRECLPK